MPTQPQSPGIQSSNSLIPQDPSQADPGVVKVMQAIKNVETQGHTDAFNATGDNGESHGAYQFNKDNYKNWATQYGVDPNDFSPAAQNKVAYARIADLKNQGLQPEEIAAKWNGAHIDPITKKLTYNNPVYGQKFRAALLGENQSSKISDTSTGPLATGVTSLGNQLASRFEQGGQAISDTAIGKINPLSGLLQTVGAGAGAVGDVTNSALKLIPGVSQVEDAIGKGAGALASTPTGQSLIKGYGEFSTAHPELSADIGAAGNIASLIPVFKGPALAKEAISSAAEKGILGTGIQNIADKVALNKALEVVSPNVTTSVAKKGIKSGLGNFTGLSKTATLGADQQTLNAATAVKDLIKDGTVSPKKTMIENANAIDTEIGKTAQDLKQKLSTMEVTPIVTHEDIGSLYSDVVKRIGEDPTLVGNAGETASRILTKFQSYLPEEEDITGLDILNARQKLDSWIRQIKGSRAFDPATDNAITIALRAVRQGANKLLADKAPNVPVKEMLQKQSRLYDALENVSAKGAKEIGTTGPQRFLKRHPTITKGAKYVGAGLLTGLGFKEASNLVGEK